MERQIPKNVRQIGNVSDSPKIYVEDYVDTFFLQLCDKAKEGPVGAFLVGDMQKSDGEDYVYIYGAIQMRELKFADNQYVIEEETWKSAYEECKQYFEDGEMLGWFVAQPGAALAAEQNIIRQHKKSFPKQNTVFIIKDASEKEEAYFVHKLNDLMEIGGHYTYYEKNPCMQNYMIASRRKNGVSPSETVEDRAAKDFRNMVRSREGRTVHRKNNRLMYAASTLLVLVVIIMGVTTLNNFDKMKSVQSSLNSLASSVGGDKDSVQVQETNGSVTAVTDTGTADAGEAGTGVSDEGTSGSGTSDAGLEDIGQGDSGEDELQTGTASDDQDSSEADDSSSSDKQKSEKTSGLVSDGVYVVEQGDTLAIISRKAYGDVSHVESICKMNGITDGNLIYVGQKLLLP